VKILNKNSFSKTLKLLEKAEKKDKKNTLLFEIIYTLKEHETALLLSNILNHSDMKEMDIKFNELDSEDKKLSLPDSQKQIYYNVQNSPKILEIISEEMSKSMVFKREGNKEFRVELMVFQRFSPVELKILFYGHYYEEVRGRQIIEEKFDVNSFDLDDD